MDKILLGFKKANRATVRAREYAALLQKKAYASLVLHRLKKRGELALVKRGWWAFPDALPEAVACEISQPCYVSFHSALYLHGLTTQIPAFTQLAVLRRVRAYKIFGIQVKEYRVNKKMFNNFYSKEGLLLATPEKAAADCLNIPRACPEMIVSEALQEIDASKLKSLVSKNGLKRLRKLVENVE